MDVTMIDLTNVTAKEGDEVELFGSHVSIAELAQLANTIPYEILTSISRRVKRVYLNE
jgi:alanine racemase